MCPGVFQYPSEQPELSAQFSSHHYRQTDPPVLQQKQGYTAGENTITQQCETYQNIFCCLHYFFFLILSYYTVYSCTFQLTQNWYLLLFASCQKSTCPPWSQCCSRPTWLKMAVCFRIWPPCLLQRAQLTSKLCPHCRTTSMCKS